MTQHKFTSNFPAIFSNTNDEPPRSRIFQDYYPFGIFTDALHPQCDIVRVLSFPKEQMVTCILLIMISDAWG
ncbi:hypothetical protein WM28_11865 [Burkholderia ubonensis]|nr:hypothetical protein WM28_11865 [Burkholderia ubonensis]